MADPHDRIRKLRAMAAPTSGATASERATATRLANELQAKHPAKPFSFVTASVSEILSRARDMERLVGGAIYFVDYPDGPELCRVSHDDDDRTVFVRSLIVGSRVSVFASGHNMDRSRPMPRRREGVVARFTPTGIVVLEDGTSFAGKDARWPGHRRGERGSGGWRTYLADPSWYYEEERDPEAVHG